MAKVIVVYETKYGNTKLAAEEIIGGMREVPGIEAHLCLPKEADWNGIADYDAIIIGSPTHAGRPTMGIRHFIGRLGKIKIEGKMAAVFDLRSSPSPGYAVTKMEKQIAKDVPGLKLLAPGISLQVSGVKGPLVEGELSRCREFGHKIASRL